MIVVVIVCLLAVIGLAVAVWRQQARIDEHVARIDGLAGELDAADNEVTEALTATARVERERDDALERVQRARRDASEVAGRLRAETELRQSLERRVADLEAELEAAQAAPAESPAARLWALALATTERTWRTSVALTPDQPSPLDGQERPLREAIEIEIDAAREEAGADIELRWELAGDVELDDAVVVLATARELVASVAKTAAHSVLTVAAADGGVDVTIEARDADGAPMDVKIPGVAATSPGRYRAAAG